MNNGAIVDNLSYRPSNPEVGSRSEELDLTWVCPRLGGGHFITAQPANKRLVVSWLFCKHKPGIFDQGLERAAHVVVLDCRILVLDTRAPSAVVRESMSGLAWLLAGLFALSTISAMVRGFADAGGFNFGWFQGYLEPMNSVRIAKSFFAALLFIPLWQRTLDRSPERAITSFSQGLLVGLAIVSLLTVWERAAFTGLLDFSSDYRTTGLFWEMHVGGAALDGFLALTVPFALRELLIARSTWRWVWGGGGATACRCC